MEDKQRAGRLLQGLFVLFVFSLPFATSFNFLGAPVQVSDLLFLAAAGVWAVALVSRRITFRFDWFYVCSAAYAVAATISTIASDDPSRSSVKLAGKILLIGIALLTFNIVTSLGVLKRVLQAWLIGAGVVVACSLVGIVLFYAGLRDASQNIVVHPSYGSLPPGNFPRIEGFFSYPAMLCNFLAVTWMFALALKSEWLRTPVFWLFAAALFIVDAFTLTPGLGGIFLASGIFAMEKLRQGTGRFVFVSGVLIAAAFLIITSVTLFSGQRLAQNIEPSARVQAWQTALETFRENPVLGRGVGMPIANAAFIDPSGSTRLLTDAHNTYLSVLGETGLVGFLTFLGIVCFVTLTLFRWKPESEAYKTVRLCLLLAMLDAFFYQSLTGSYEDTRHLWVLFGIAAAVVQKEKASVNQA